VFCIMPKIISLGEILSLEDIERYISLMAIGEKEKIKEELQNRKAELRDKGVDAGYLYYLLEYLYLQLFGELP